MKVTMPEMIKAVAYVSFTAGILIHKNKVVDIIEAKEKDKMLYTSPNWESLIANIMVGKVYGATALKAAMSFHR
jgi:hypothetical protein